MFAALENLSVREDIKWTWEFIIHYKKPSAE